MRVHRRCVVVAARDSRPFRNSRFQRIGRPGTIVRRRSCESSNRVGGVTSTSPKGADLAAANDNMPCISRMYT
ncbi:hypothetical protein I546_3143 [Mycobacterium kansasii 732]|nr:hypothetical protein I546_3143 [Mycobacterium kansasii 732]